MKHNELPPRVYEKGKWYYLVTAQGDKRIWTKLTMTREGIAALYKKLGEVKAKDVAPDLLPMVAQEWLKDRTASENDEWAVREISKAFREFRVREVTTSACLAFLKKWKDANKARTYNLMRFTLGDIMRFAEGLEQDRVPFRDPGTNPVTSIKRMSTPARDRYPTDSEVRRIKFHAMVSRPGKGGYRGRNRSGPILAALIDLAYLTGQRVGDLLDLRWTKLVAMEKGEVAAPYIAKDGLHFKPSKTEKTTGAKVLIRWTPRLKAVIERIKAMDRKKHPMYVLTNQNSERLLYSTFATAWWRACDRAGIKGLHFHDLKAKALTDVKRARGIKDANIMGAHSTEGQTVDYVREMEARETDATR